MGRTGDGMRMLEENFSQGTNWSSIYSFFKLFTWKWFQTYRCKNKNSTQNTHITFTQIRLLLNICPTCFIICFLSRVLFLTYIQTLLHSHSTHTYTRDTHIQINTCHPLLGLCVVFYWKTTRKYQGVVGSRWRESKRGLNASTALSVSLPPMQAASSQVFWFRDELVSGRRPEKVLVTEDSWLVLSFSLNNKNHKKTTTRHLYKPWK